MLLPAFLLLPLSELRFAPGDAETLILVLVTVLAAGAGILLWHSLRNPLGRNARPSLAQSSADTPAILLVQDLSPAVLQLKKLRQMGITNLPAYLDQNQDISQNLFRNCLLLDANPQAFQHLSADSLTSFRMKLVEAYQSPWKEFFRAQLLMVWSDCLHVQEECVCHNITGQSATWFMSCQCATSKGAPDFSRTTLLAIDVSLARSVLSNRLTSDSGVGNILAQANTLLWWAKVKREGSTFHWRVQTPIQSVYSPIYRLASAISKGGLWDMQEMPDAEAMTRVSSTALRNGAPGYQHEFRCLAPEGLHWLREDVSIQAIAENEWNLVGIVTDITQRRLAEIEQNEEAERLRSLLRNLSVAIIGLSRSAHISYTNLAAANLMEAAPRDCIGRFAGGLLNLSWPGCVDPDIEKLCIANQPFTLPEGACITLHSGRRIPVSGHLRPVQENQSTNLFCLLSLQELSAPAPLSAKSGAGNPGVSNAPTPASTGYFASNSNSVSSASASNSVNPSFPVSGASVSISTSSSSSSSSTSSSDASGKPPASSSASASVSISQSGNEAPVVSSVSSHSDAPRPAAPAPSVPLRVLFMDDEEPIRILARKILSRQGIDVVVAADGSQALSLYKQAQDEQHRFDVVILDLNVPGGLGGRETIEQLLVLDPAVRAIVSSGYDSSPNELRDETGSPQGFLAAVTKPYDVKTLVETVKRVAALPRIL